MTLASPPIRADFDAVDQLDETQLLELSEGEIEAIVELRRARLARAHEELAERALEEAELRREHGQRLDAVAAHEPEVARARESTRIDPGQLLFIDAYWHMQFPRASAVVCEHERLQKFADEMEPLINRVHERWVWLRRTCLLYRPPMVEQAEQALVLKRKQREAILAPPPPQHSLLEVAKRLVSTGRWNP